MPSNADLKPLPLALLTAGGVLLYAAIKNKQPLPLIKAVLTGGDISKVPALYTGSLGGNSAIGDAVAGLSGKPTSTAPADPNGPNSPLGSTGTAVGGVVQGGLDLTGLGDLGHIVVIPYSDSTGYHAFGSDSRLPGTGYRQPVAPASTPVVPGSAQSGG